MLQIKTYRSPSYILSALILLSCVAVNVSGQSRITLQEAVDNALKNNIQVKQSQLSESLSETNLKESKLALLPSLNASSNLNFNFGRNVDPFSYQFVNQQITSSNGSIYTSLPLFQGFQRIKQISQNKYTLEADKSNTRKLKNDLALTVVTTYLQILNYQDLLKASDEQLNLAKQQLDIEQKQFDVGNKTLADLSQAKAQVANAELNRTNALNQLEIAYLNLAQLMERNPAERFEVVQPAVNELTQTSKAYSAADVYSKAVENYPDIQLAQYRTLSAAKAVDVAKSGLYPRLAFQGSVGTGYSSLGQRVFLNTNGAPGNEKAPFDYQIKNNLNQTIGFSLSIPLFNGYTSKYAVRRARIGLQNAEYSEQLARNTFNKTIYQAVTDLRAAESRYNSAQTAYQSSQDVFDAIQKRYNVGLVNSLDFNQAQTNLNRAQFDLIQARYDLIFRSKVIDFYLGNPITF